MDILHGVMGCCCHLLEFGWHCDSPQLSDLFCFGFFALAQCIVFHFKSAFVAWSCVSCVFELMGGQHVCLDKWGLSDEVCVWVALDFLHPLQLR